MPCGDLHADTRLALRNNGIEKADYINAFIEQFSCKLLCQFCLVKHDRDDRVLTRQNIEARFGHSLAEVLRIPFQFIA
ncbi:hypothetical protein D3C87_2130430 [compost metagenome]